MASTNSIKKNVRQNLKRKLANRSKKNRIVTYEKKIRKSIGTIPIEEINLLLKKYISYIDKAAKKNIMHRNKANRKKSKIQLFVNQHQNIAKESTTIDNS